MRPTSAPTDDGGCGTAVPVGVRRLSVEDVVRVARDGQRVACLAPEVAARVQATAAWVADTVEQIAADGQGSRKPAAYYGINTGFGARAGRSALGSKSLIELLGRNLIVSHSVGVGPYFDEAVVRAALLIRAQSLAQGYSGVRPLVVETLLRLLNEGVYPAVPEQGSLGASGDLAPLAHLMLAISRPPAGLACDATDGEAFVPWEGPAIEAGGCCHVTEQYATGEQQVWRRVPAAEALAAAGGRIELRAK
jgi:histidine ammonia-lyase